MRNKFKKYIPKKKEELKYILNHRFCNLALTSERKFWKTELNFQNSKYKKKKSRHVSMSTIGVCLTDIRQFRE